METPTTLYSLISAVLDIPVEHLDPEIAIRSIPNVDSIKILNVVLNVEKAYGIEIPDEVTFGLETLGEFEEFIAETLAAPTDR
jgi:acyl carrier protein